MVAVYGSSVERNCFRRFEKRAIEKTEKVPHAWAGRGTQICLQTYTKSLRINASYERTRA